MILLRGGAGSPRNGEFLAGPPGFPMILSGWRPPEWRGSPRQADAIGRALREHTGLSEALAAYERRRQAELLSVRSAARYSSQWYENVPRYIQLPPHRMFALLGRRHSPLLPYVPPQLYYGLDKAAGQLEPLRRLKRWLGPRAARALHARRR